MATGSEELREYNATAIQIVNAERVRQRPGMFFGDIHSTGLRTLLFQVLDAHLPPMDKASTTKWVVELLGLGACRLTIRGFSGFDEIAPATLFDALTSANGYIPGYRMQWELFIANAVCLDSQLSITRGGKTWSQEFSRGYPISPLTVISTTGADGIALTFQADPEIFSVDADFDYPILAQRLGELAYLCPRLTLQLVDHRAARERTETFHAPDGLGDYVHFLNRDRRTYGDVISFGDGDGESSFRLALQWTHDEACRIRTYANGLLTKEGGTHLVALRTALAHTIGKYGRLYDILQDESLTENNCVQGLTAVLAVEVESPCYGGPTKDCFNSLEVGPLIQKSVSYWFAAFLETDESSARAIIARALAVYQAEDAAAAEAAKEARRGGRASRNRC